MRKVMSLIRQHKGILLYLVFGVLTTAVNYIVYLPCFNYLGLSSALSNCIAWCVAVAFAFLTNKPVVFQSRDWSIKTLLPELSKFVSCRFATGLIETIALFVAVDLAHLDGNAIKVITSVAVIVLNYVGSKIFVFARRSPNE